MSDFFETISDDRIDSVLSTVGKVESVAIVRKVGSTIDRVAPVIVAEEALIFVAWQRQGNAA